MVEKGADPTLIILLANELQNRIGILPIVKVDAYNLPNEYGIIYRIMRVSPNSLSEISRVIRAARTMKLHIRCIGSGSSLNRMILMNDFSVVLDLKHLSDSERIERIRIPINDSESVYGIRVLAGVTIQELCEYEILNQICFATNTESLDRTVIGSIISGSHGAVTNASSSLADYVLQVRIVDIHGEIQTYSEIEMYGEASCGRIKSTGNIIKSIISGLGMLGVVYDVIIRFNPLKTVRVNYEFLTIEKLFSNMASLKEKIQSHLSTQLIYVPYNSVEFDCQNNKVKIDEWSAWKDEIILRTMTESDSDSKIRQFINVIDESQGCLNTILEQSHLTPLVLRASHQIMRRDFLLSTDQYLPWAIHCFPLISTGFHEVTVTLDLQNMVEFAKVLELILRRIEGFAKERKNYSVNGGLRVNFTNGTGVTLCPGQKKSIQNKCVHIKLMGIMLSPGWKDLVFPVIDEILRQIPSAILQWSSEWIDRPIVIERILELEGPYLQKLKEEIEIMDRDGVFLNDYLQRIFYPVLQSYRATYKHLQNEFMMTLR